jgi:electron transfer flavoprotein beta subunit
VPSLNLISCVKQVLDPEAPASGYRIEPGATQVSPVGIPPVISPFDENALEAALRLRESHGGKVTSLSVGHKLSKAALRKALFAGGDELILVDAPAFHDEKLDPSGIAWVLSEAIHKIGTFDLVLAGRQASDTNAGVVGAHLAELLAIPLVTLAQKITVEEGTVRVERVTPDGYQVVEAAMPALVTVSSEIGELRKLNIKQMREMRKRPVHVWTEKDLGLGSMPEKHLSLERLCAPERSRKCTFIEAGSPAEAGERLAIELREDDVL